MNWLEVLFLAYLFVLIPRAAHRSAKIIRGGSAGPVAGMTRTRIYLNTMISMAVLGLMTWAVARFDEMELLPRAVWNWRVLAIGGAALAVKLAFVFVRLWIGKGINTTTVHLAPRTMNERVLAVLLIAMAAVVEECAYRGLAFLILFTHTGSIIASILCAVAFGLAHLVQGRRAVLITFVYALIDHAVYLSTGTLFILIATHFLYDVIVAFVLSARAARSTITTYSSGVAS